MSRRIAVASLLLLVALLAPAARAHDARPAHLEIRQIASERYTLLWRTPVFSGMPLPVVVRLPEDVVTLGEPTPRDLGDSRVERAMIEVPGGLAGRRIEFPGLEATITDALVRVSTLDGRHTTQLARPSQPWVEITGRESKGAIVRDFARHGVEHILLGYDHLLFVLALLLIVRSLRVLLWTITAFTLAHSITLALATLGVVRVPGPPVEATIALSIVLLAAELVRFGRGQTSLTARWPWIVAFCFGLLHGFGFAGALTEIGLPREELPLALFAFNVGVELGQLAFVGALVALAALATSGLEAQLRDPVRRALPYGIGILAAFWFFERVAAF